MKIGWRLDRFGRWSLIAIMAIMVVSVASLAEACPLCKQALNNTEQPAGDIAGGYFWSILFMMSMPFLLLGSFSGYMYLAVRKARRELAARQGATEASSTAAPASTATAPQRETVDVS